MKRVSKKNLGLICFGAIVLLGIISLLILLIGKNSDYIQPDRTIYFILSAFGANIYLLLFLLPGFAVSLLFPKTKEREERRILSSFLISGVVAWAIWWVYYFSAKGGQIAALAVMIIAALGVVLIMIRRKKPMLSQSLQTINTQNIWILNIVMIAALMYSFMIYLYPVDNDVFWQAANRYRGMPIDNQLQNMLVERLYSGQALEPFAGDWLSSDRPPLLSAIILLIKPLSVMGDAFFYQFTGTAVNCLFLAGIVQICRYLRTGERGIKLALFIALFSGYFVQNTGYLWPKVTMIAPFCLIYGVLWEVLFRNKDRTGISAGPGGKEIILQCLLCGAGLAACVLLHGGSAFTLIAFAIMILINRPKISTTWLIILGAALLIYLPWILYQKVLVPPGDRLLKYHFSDVTEVTEASFIETLKTQYGSLTPEQIISNKMININTLFAMPNGITRNTIIDYQFFYFFGCFGILVFAIFYLWKERIIAAREPGHDLDIPKLRNFVWILIVSLLLYCLLKFKAGSTIIHEGSPIAVLMLLILIAWGLTYAPAKIQIAGCVIHFGVFIYAYAMKDGMVRNGLIAPFIIAVAAIIASIILMPLRPERAEAITDDERESGGRQNG